jgi:ligand-binding sensor domain-containing protein
MISYSAVDETPYSIAAGDNNVYIAYKFGGITVYDGNNFKIFKKDSGLPIEGFYSVVVDRNKNVFASSFGLGVLKYTDGVWNHINSKNSELKEDTIFSTFVDSNNTKWFCTLNSGLCLFNENSIALK